MKRWILASQAKKMGRLYWSSQRGWTYMELASLYAEPTPETIPIAFPITRSGGVWLEVEVSTCGYRKVLEPQEWPQITDLRNLGFTVPSMKIPVRGIPNCVAVYRGYQINVYLKETA